MALILSIDDDPAYQKILSLALIDEGHVMYANSSGKEALEFLKIRTPDLILLDVMLPEPVTGFDVLRVIRQMPKTANIPVIVLTNMSESQEKARELGSSDYIIKAHTDIPTLLSHIGVFLRKTS